MSTIASYHQVKKEKPYRSYKENMSNYKTWEQKAHATDYLLYPQNIADKLAIDEVSLSEGELYTFVTSKRSHGNKKKLVAVINGTEAKTIMEVLHKIDESKRSVVKEVSLDMAPNMELAVKKSFQNADRVTDRFHVVKLIIEALQHLRVKYRWEAIALENEAIKQAKQQGIKYKSKIFPNGDTRKELLARSRYLLFKSEDKWTETQAKRASILFNEYPLLAKAYKLTLQFRAIYQTYSKNNARKAILKWIEKVNNSGIDEFNTAANSILYHLETILNFFNNRSTNAVAESFNAKLKGFRANLRGVTDVEFFLFRLEKLFA
jgi:transposase